MKVIAFVFARGGSKGLPGKNILELGGIPLVGHSIRVAKSLPEVSAVFVSTDSPEIANIAATFGAAVIERPSELSSDTASEWDAWRHAIAHVRNLGIEFDVFLSLPATSPLRNTADVQNCLGALTADTDVVITVTSASRSPFFNMVKRGPDGIVNKLIESETYTRRQDAPEAFDMTTVAYVLRPDFIFSSPSLFSGRVKSIVIPKERAVDIDDLWDFKYAECLYQELNK